MIFRELLFWRIYFYGEKKNDEEKRYIEVEELRDVEWAIECVEKLKKKVSWETYERFYSFVVVSSVAFAMTGALAWQVKKPNKKFMFLFSGGRWYGVDFLFYPRPSPLVRVLPFFFRFFLLAFLLVANCSVRYQTHNKFTVESQRQISFHTIWLSIQHPLQRHGIIFIKERPKVPRTYTYKLFILFYMLAQQIKVPREH